LPETGGIFLRFIAEVFAGGNNRAIVAAVADLTSRFMPSSDIYREAIGRLRSPRTGLVLMQWDHIIQDRVDNRPCSLYYILANKQQFVPVHGVR
jgi:hypothetical protein